MLNVLMVNINDEIFSLVLRSSIEGRKHCRKNVHIYGLLDILHISGHYLHTRMKQKKPFYCLRHMSIGRVKA